MGARLELPGPYLKRVSVLARVFPGGLAATVLQLVREREALDTEVADLRRRLDYGSDFGDER